MQQMEASSAEEEIKLNAYFRNRGIDPDYYKSFQLPQYLKDELPGDKSKKILDIGCGFGQMLLRLREAGFQNISGIDIGNESVEYCKKQGLSVFMIQSIQEYADQHPGEYDCIIMSHVLEHIPKEKIIETLIAIRKMLRPKGYYIVMVPNAQSNTGPYWMYEDFTHHLLFTAGSLLYVLQSAGFQNIEFLDIKCLKGLSPFQKWKRRLLVRLYEIRLNFWNRATASSFHKPSPRIYSFEIKAKALA